MFDHRKMAQWADSFLTKAYGLEPRSYVSSFEPHHQHMGEKLRLYHHDTHFKEVTGSDWAEVKQGLEKEIQKQKLDFCYPETHEVVTWLLTQPFKLAILTFGKREYQLYKINSCAFLRSLDLPIYVVREHKRYYLEREFKNVSRGVLVDDKHPMKLHSPWESIWIDRKSKQVDVELLENRVHKINSLKRLQDILT